MGAVYGRDRACMEAYRGDVVRDGHAGLRGGTGEGTRWVGEGEGAGREGPTSRRTHLQAGQIPHLKRKRAKGWCAWM